jgi:hypothetical protein
MRITTCTDDDFYTLWNFSHGTIPIINLINSNGTMGTEANRAIRKLYPEEMFDDFLKWINLKKKSNFQVLKYEGCPPLINVIGANNKTRRYRYDISKTIRMAINRNFQTTQTIAFFDNNYLVDAIDTTWIYGMTAQKYYPSIVRDDEE